MLSNSPFMDTQAVSSLQMFRCIDWKRRQGWWYGGGENEVERQQQEEGIEEERSSLPDEGGTVEQKRHMEVDPTGMRGRGGGGGVLGVVGVWVTQSLGQNAYMGRQNKHNLFNARSVPLLRHHWTDGRNLILNQFSPLHLLKLQQPQNIPSVWQARVPGAGGLLHYNIFTVFSLRFWNVFLMKSSRPLAFGMVFSGNHVGHFWSLKNLGNIKDYRIF